MKIKNFTFEAATKIRFTDDLAEALEASLTDLAAKKVFIVTDKSLSQLKPFQNFINVMDELDVDYTVCNKAMLNTSDQAIDHVFSFMKDSSYDCIIGFGGGSSLDTAKVCAILATNGGKTSDYFGVNQVPKMPLPVISIPTTAGSGADVTKIMSIVDFQKDTKSQIMDDKSTPEISIIYPQNLIGTPQHLIPALGFDSLTHCIEGYINAKANPITEALSIKAFEFMSQNLVKFYNDNQDIDAAGANLLGTSIGCMACSSIGTGDAHCIARSVGGKYHQIHHGVALSVVLPHVLNFNLEGSQKKLAELARVMGLNVSGMSYIDAAKELILAVQEIRNKLDLPKSYQELGMNLKDLDELALASKYKSEHGSSAGAPPRRATIEEYKQLLIDAYNGLEIQY